jgi:hypothetical protein
MYACPIDISIHHRRARGIHGSDAKRRGGIFLSGYYRSQIRQFNG